VRGKGTSDAIVVVKVVCWELYMVKVHWKRREKRKEGNGKNESTPN
jgi:hypothetical protein